METELSREIRSALERVPGVVSVTRIQSGVLHIGGRYIHCAPKGTPDLLVLQTKGRVCFLEIKTDEGLLGDEQAAWHNKHAKGGHRVGVARSVKEAVDFVIGRRANG